MNSGPSFFTTYFHPHRAPFSVLFKVTGDFHVTKSSGHFSVHNLLHLLAAAHMVTVPPL